MAIIQTSDQVRYLRRKNLDEEARIIGNYYSDAISMYGIDCVYHKMDMSEFSDFKGIVDQNTVLKRAYGYDITPDYSVSAEMVTFAEVDADIFNINKIGYTPNTEITLVFDSTKFACDMAPKVGRYREYRVTEREIAVEVPALSDGPWPYQVEAGYDVVSESGEMMRGRMRCVLSGYQVGHERTEACDPYEHTDFSVRFPKNGDLYHSLSYSVRNDDYLETMLFLTFTVDRVSVGNGAYRYLLRGRTHGSVLFFDLDQLGKYSERIHPAVGDLVDIDFPDENNRERYEITDCFDKQLTQDGINPLLHKYVWKCKARRHICSFEDSVPGANEADSRLLERRDYDAAVQDAVGEKVQSYEDVDPENGVRQDAVYGGYDGVTAEYDKQAARRNYVRYDQIEGSQCVDVMRFGCGSRLVTDGYELIFVDGGGDAYVVTHAEHPPTVDACLFESRTKWLKATDSQVVFVNVEGESTVLAYDTEASAGEELALDDARESTVGGDINSNGDSFVKFGGTRTVLFATPDALYAKLASKGRSYRLA